MKRMLRISGAALAFCAVLLLSCGCTAEVDFIPNWAQFNNREFQADLDGDGKLEAISLKDKALTISSGTNSLSDASSTEANEVQEATLPEGRYTSDVWVHDLDYDGIPEVITLTWKRGSFGPYRPFWHTDEDDEMTQHVFVFSYVDGQLHDKWLSSDVRMEISEASMDAAGRLTLTLTDGTQEVCEWQEWGFAFLDENNPSWNDALYDYASIVVAGDVIAHQNILELAYQDDGSYCFDELFEPIMPFVQKADVAIVNQEGPLVSESSLVSGEFPQFGVPAEMASAYAQAGFDAVALANNHILDRGVEGIQQTQDELEAAGLSTVGLLSPGENTSPYQPLIIETNGIRIGLVNATSLLNGADSSDEAQLVAQTGQGNELIEYVRELSSRVDFTLCYLHAGEEYSFEPTQDEGALAECLIDAGAQTVIYSHPHVVQRAETLVTDAGNTGVVFYSLGNLIASQTDPNTAEGLLAQIIVRKEKDSDAKAVVADFSAIPTVCHITEDSAQVFMLEDYDATLAREHWFSETDSDWLAHVRERTGV